MIKYNHNKEKEASPMNKFDELDIELHMRKGEKCGKKENACVQSGSVLYRSAVLGV